MKKKTRRMMALTLGVIFALGAGTGLSEIEGAEKREEKLPQEKIVETIKKETTEKAEDAEKTVKTEETEMTVKPESSEPEEKEAEVEPDKEAEADKEATEEAETPAETETLAETEVPAETEASAETEAPEANKPELPKLRVICEPRTVTGIGETIRLIAKVTGGDAYKLSYQWQCDLGDGNGFEDVKGATDDAYEFVVTDELLHAKWRVEVSYKQKSQNDVPEGKLITGVLIEKAEFSVKLEAETEEEPAQEEEQTSVENESEEILSEEEQTEVENEPVEESEAEIAEPEEGEAEEAVEGEEEVEEEREPSLSDPDFEPDAPEVSLSWDARDVMDPGETVTITATLTNAQYYDFTFQWQCDTGSGFEDVPGATSATYQFPASAELLSADWQVVVGYEKKLPDMPEAVDAPLAPAE